MTQRYRWDAAAAASHLESPTGEDDKYSRGVVGLRTGSAAYPGAAVLGAEAAIRAGAGMLRYVGPARVADAVLARRPEAVIGEGRVQAWVIGSGTDASARTPAETDALRGVLRGDVPVIVDAGALDLVEGAAAPLVLTPHAREHAALRRRLGLAEDDDRERAVAETAARLRNVVLLKGAQTLVAVPGGDVLVVADGTGWLATAGTGDVLGGAIGAIVAAGQARAEAAGRTLSARALAELAATGAFVHQAAGRRASGTEEESGAPGHPAPALDVAHAVSGAIGALLR